MQLFVAIRGIRFVSTPVALMILMVTLGIVQPALAQKGKPSNQSGFRSALPEVSEAPTRSAAEVGQFLESLGTNDAAMEVLVGQGRLLTLKTSLVAAGKSAPVIAVGDPSVVDFQVVGPRQIRVIGQRIGQTDLSITTADGETHSFEVAVVLDLKLLSARLKAVFPEAQLKLGQIAGHVVVEGQARDSRQVANIVKTIEVYLESTRTSQARRVTGTSTAGGGASGQPGAGGAGSRPPAAFEDAPPPGIEEEPLADVGAENQNLRVSGQTATPRVINLIQVPGSQQVMLKVQVAELNRTSLRNLGVSALFSDGTTAIGSNIGGKAAAASALPFLSPATTIAGTVLSNGKSFNYWIDALRRNNVLKVLAEPTLVAYHGHEASFLAGGEFPVPVPQGGGGGVGGAGAVTVQFKEFGVRLNFVPYIMDDEVIRLTVSPEVSTIDRANQISIVAGGDPIPGLNSRKLTTTVEMRHGQTLAMAGLLQVTLEATTIRIPGLGDTPVIGALFSNNTGVRQEKELVILVTPYLVEPRSADECLPLPGDEVNEPNDLEFYLLQRIESRVGRDFRSTTKWDNPQRWVERLKLEQRYVAGPHGYPD